MSIFSEEITRGDYYQNNDRSKFLGGCFTYDWIIEGQNEETDDFEMIFSSIDEGDVTIMKAILVGKSGRQMRLTKIIDEPQRVVYRGKLAKDERTNAKVRYWRPNNRQSKNIDVPIADRIKVEERWF